MFDTNMFLLCGILNSTKYKYGITPKEYRKMKKDPFFYENDNMVKLHQYDVLASTFFIIAIVLASALFILLKLLILVSKIDLIWHSHDGLKLEVHSFSSWKYKNVEIGNPNYDYELDIMGYSIIMIGILTFSFYYLSYFYLWKITDVKRWEGSIFYENYRKEYKESNDTKIKALQISSLIINIIGTILFIAVIIDQLIPADLTEYIVNFTNYVEPNDTRIYLEPASISFIFVLLSAAVIHIIGILLLCWLCNITCEKFKCIIVSIYKNELKKREDSEVESKVDNKKDFPNIKSKHVLDNEIYNE